MQQKATTKQVGIREVICRFKESNGPPLAYFGKYSDTRRACVNILTIAIHLELVLLAHF